MTSQSENAYTRAPKHAHTTKNTIPLDPSTGPSTSQLQTFLHNSEFYKHSDRCSSAHCTYQKLTEADGGSLANCTNDFMTVSEHRTAPIIIDATNQVHGACSAASLGSAERRCRATRLPS